MTVTKQQQLEWLASSWESWHHSASKLFMSKINRGCFVSMINDSHQITLEEWKRERDKMSSKPEVDNSWHESGELPPVGCVVDVTGDDVAYGYGESDCEVLAHVEDCAVIRMSFGLGCFVAKVLSPSRTEREMAIDEMDAALRNRGSAISDVILGELYDAGFRMVKP